MKVARLEGLLFALALPMGVCVQAGRKYANKALPLEAWLTSGPGRRFVRM